MKKTMSLALCVAVIMFSVVACSKKKKSDPTTTIDCLASGLVVTTTDITKNKATVTATGGTGPYQYSVGGTTYQSSNVLTLENGNNNIFVKDANACTAGTIATCNAFADSRDGQVYSTVTIGTQTWMSENLNYNASGSLCYNASSDSCAKYGKLYDGTTAQTVCPNGYHLPSDTAWKILEIYLGMSVTEANMYNTLRGTDQGTKLLVNGSSGFNAKFSGAYNGSNVGVGTYTLFWSSTLDPINTGNYYTRVLTNSSTKVSRQSAPSTNNFYCVRCLKD
jgi:uncharacterized protein (TIGR02145 family)